MWSRCWGSKSQSFNFLGMENLNVSIPVHGNGCASVPGYRGCEGGIHSTVLQHFLQCSHFWNIHTALRSPGDSHINKTTVEMCFLIVLCNCSIRKSDKKQYHRRSHTLPAYSPIATWCSRTVRRGSILFYNCIIWFVLYSILNSYKRWFLGCCIRFTIY